ncbi:hypothetical protein [Citrobacter youngae]|uniref:hypothetical protein n=1 Tax=Citrobacter youngae TaxID=133448 RepID=UPI0039B6D72D
MKIQYRKIYYALEPRKSRLHVQNRSNSKRDIPQPWHCKPFQDACMYGLEIRFSWKTPCKVYLKQGCPVWLGDISAELPPEAPPNWHPFSTFAPGYFGLSPLLDIQVPEGMGLFILPHARCLLDTSGTAPIAIPGLVETSWWPRPFFLVFKAPLERNFISFDYGDPIAQLLVLPLNEQYEIQEMDAATALLRNRRSQLLAKYGKEFSTRITYNDNGYPSFDNKYKELSKHNHKHGFFS